MASPFEASVSRPGYGSIKLSLLLAGKATLETLSHQYPLKLIAPSPSTVYNQDAVAQSVYTVYLLTYGGGIVAGDSINLSISLAQSTRLVLLTQGSTRIYKTPRHDLLSYQRMVVRIAEGSALCYLPDPVQPFANSAFEQTQIYTIIGQNGNLCVCDWVCEGRRARGEAWDFLRYVSRNEVWWEATEATAGIGAGKRTLLLRDNLILDRLETSARTIVERVGGLGAYGTLILRGAMFESLGRLFLEEFAQLPRLGSKKWDDSVKEDMNDNHVLWQKARQTQEAKDGLVWTAANVRGFVLVKFGANEVEGVKKWLGSFIKLDGSIEKEFGERALLCLR